MSSSVLTWPSPAVSPISLTSANAPGGAQPVLLVLDARLQAASDAAAHARSTSSSVLISGAQLLEFAQAAGVDSKVVDFEALAR